MTKDKELVLHWKKFAHEIWANKKAPWKPSKGEIKLWEQMLKRVLRNNKKPKVLVLGATPEFRDLFARYPMVKVFLADISKEMKQGMDELLKSKPKNEKFVKTDWRKMPFANEYFDIAIGDTPHHNIKKTTYPAFFKEIKRVLKPGGYLLLSSWFFGKQKGLSMKEFINLYKRNPRYFRNFENRTYALWRLGKKVFHSRKTWEWHWEKVEQAIAREYKKQKLPEKDIKYLMFDFAKYIQVCPREPDFSKLLSKYFAIEKTWQEKTHPAMQVKKDWVLKKK